VRPCDLLPFSNSPDSQPRTVSARGAWVHSNRKARANRELEAERTLLDNAVSAARAALVAALQAAFTAQRGVPHSLESAARAFARASREAGIDVAEVLIEVKALIRDQVAADEPLFTPKVVGWTVAGYFTGTGRKSEGS
jgi:hypothetical protein